MSARHTAPTAAMPAPTPEYTVPPSAKFPSAQVETNTSTQALATPASARSTTQTAKPWHSPIASVDRLMMRSPPRIAVTGVSGRRMADSAPAR